LTLPSGFPGSALVRKEEAKPMARYGAAVIGVGSSGGDFVRIFRQNDRTELRAICDIDARRLAEAMGPLPGVAGYTDFWQVAERSDVDLVAICTPDHLHTEPAVAMMEAGKHVIIEKPLATTWEGLRRTVAAARRTGRKVAHGTQLRWMPLHQEVKRRLSQGILGELYYAEADYGGYSVDLFTAGWRGEPGIDYNLVAGGGVHILDLLLWFVEDEVVEVFGYGNRKCITQTGLDTFDCLTAVLKFRHGAIAKTTTSFGTDRPQPPGIELCGTQGCYLSGPEPRFGRGARQPQFETLVVDPPGDLRALLVEDFLGAIENDTQPLTHLTAAAQVTAVCIAAFESAKTGRPVSLAGRW
jgi:predicted dehydrogenase